jgi:hypothetical protein
VSRACQVIIGLPDKIVDVLKSVEIVLASGEQVTASFTFQCFEQKNPVFAGPLVFLPDKIPQIVEFANKFHNTNDGNQAMLIGFSAPPPANAPVVLTQLFYNGPEEDGKAFFADLFALGPVANMTAMIPYETLNSLLNHAAGFEGRKQFGGGAFKLPLDASVLTGLHEEFVGFVDAHERMNESMMLFEIVPYKKIVETRNDAMAFSNRGDYYNVATMFKWCVDPNLTHLSLFLTKRRFDPALDAEIRDFSRTLLKKASETATSRSKDEGVGQYGNYANSDVAANDIFGPNVKRLEDLKHKYDPGNLFGHGTRLTPRPLVVVN